MRPHLPAALCAILASLAPAARAQDVPEPESHRVLEPPAQEAPAPQRPTAEPRLRPDRPELGFQLRAGAAGTDRFLVGGSFSLSSGPLTFGLSTDGIFDVRSGHHRHDGDDDWGDWCHDANGRCLRRADVALSGFGGLRQRSTPFVGSTRLRLELVGELGWQYSTVEERIERPGGAVWSDDARAYPFAGVRGSVAVAFHSAYVGVGGLARQGLAGKVCLNTDGGCTHAGGLTGGVFLLGGAEWGVGH